MKRAAIYARISTNEGRQHLENQVAECERFIDAPMMIRAFQVLPTYTDIESGGKADRPGLRRMFKDAAAHRFDTLVVFDLSRLTREGPARAFEYIQKLQTYGVEFISVNEAHFRTGGIAGELLIAIAAYFASEERRTIRARVQAGVDRARKAGKILGRRPQQIDPAALLKLHAAGKSIRQIAHHFSVSKSTIERRIKKVCPS